MTNGGFSLSSRGFFGSFPENPSLVNEATAATPCAGFPSFPTAVASLVGQFSKLFLDGSEDARRQT
jgi:hypothetical protein